VTLSVRTRTTHVIRNPSYSRRLQVADVDVLMVDEAHDATAAMMSAVVKMSQCNVATVVVYDEHQWINQQQHAVDPSAFDELECTHTGKLNTTFRYGRPLSKLTAGLIQYFKGADSFRVHRAIPTKRTEGAFAWCCTTTNTTTTNATTTTGLPPLTTNTTTATHPSVRVAT
jgi:hypothetical protein